MAQGPQLVQITNAVGYGRVWYVRAGGRGSGISAAAPLGTIQAAANLAQTGDTILVYPGSYDETVTINTDGVSLVGAVAGGYERPDLARDAGRALVVNAQGFYARHMRFYSGDSDTVQHHGNGATYLDCVFDGDAGQAATETCLRLVGATDDRHTASENRVVDCLFRGSGGAGVIMQHALAAAGGAGTSDNQLIGCTFVGNTVDLLSSVNTNGGGAGIYLRLLVSACSFMTVGSAYVYADLGAGVAGDLAANSGLVAGCWFADAALIAAQIDLASQPNVMFVGNYDASGLVDGSTFNAGP